MLHYLLNLFLLLVCLLLSSALGAAPATSPAQSAAVSLKRPAADLDGVQVVASVSPSASGDGAVSGGDSSDDEETIRQKIALFEMKLHLKKKMKATATH